jgi:hypothetical protein
LENALLWEGGNISWCHLGEKILTNEEKKMENVSGGKKHTRGDMYTSGIHAAVYKYMDDANTLPAPSESYFTLAWCSESNGFMPTL